MSILTAEEAGARILPETPTDDDLAELQEMCDAADEVVAKLTGSVVDQPRTWSGRCRPGDIVLPWRFRSIVSVTVDGATIPAGQYDAVTGAAAGLLRGLNGTPWAGGQTVTVTAQVGDPVPPAVIRLAAIEMVGHWWQLRQQRGKGSFTPDGNVYSIHSVPFKVTELLAMRPGLPGIA